MIMHRHDHLNAIRRIGKDITFVRDGNIEITAASSQIDSGFDVDNGGFSGREEYERRLGVLKPGREWIAFTFQDQGIHTRQYAKNFSKIIEFSEKQLLDAYSRMPIAQQGWAKGTPNEIDYILDHVGEVENAIDLGCGIGRHTIELVKDTKLPAEYVIRDKRYTMKEVVGLLENEGFTVVTSRYVRAGHFDESLRPLDKHAKEILVIARKEAL